MTFKKRIIIFFIILLIITPSIYFFGIWILYQREPFEISFYEHIDVYNSFMDKSLNPKLKIFIIFALAFPFLAFFSKKNIKGDFGNASFATRAMIKKMNLFQKQGIILGLFNNKKIIYKEFLATLVLAPPGTGKTAGISIPNLLTFKDSCFVLDVKGELYQKTSKHREKVLNNKVYRFNPASFDTLKFNPLDKNVLGNLEWFLKENIVDEIAILIYPKLDNVDDFWVITSRIVFSLFALYLIFKHEHTSIPNIREMLLMDFSSIYEDEDLTDGSDAFLYFVKTEMQEDESLNIRINELAGQLLLVKPETFSNILISATSALDIFSTSTVRECFRSNEIDILKFRKEKSSIYITIEEKDLARFATILKIFIEFNLRQLLSTEPDNKDFSLMLLLDEFPRFGKIPYLVDAPELGRSYKIITLLIAQDYGQIEEVYGKAKVSRINTSTAYKVIFPQTNLHTAELTSKYIGKLTRETASESNSSGNKGNANKSVSKQNSGYSLLTEQDFLNMNDGNIYILAKNNYQHPIISKPNLYFLDRKLKKLVPQEK